MGISSLLSLIAGIGFIAFLGGIGLAVVASSQGRSWRGGAALAALGLIAGLVFSFISQSIIIVEPTQVAVVIRPLEGSVEEPRKGGTHIITPIFQQIAAIYPITQQEYTMAARSTEGAVSGNDAVESRTNDGQTISMDVTIIFRIDADEADLVYRSWNNYLESFIRPTTRSLVREVVSRYTAEEIYGEARTQLGDDMEEVIGARFSEEGFLLTDLLVRDITFSESFTASIEEKVVAEQQALQAEIRVRQEQQEAERVRERARGERDAEIARAEGESQAIVLRAQAEAEALRLVSEQIAANPSLIQYLYVQNLSDNVNIALVPSNSPFLFDFNSLAAPDGSFVAPDAAAQLPIDPAVTPTPSSGG